MRMPFSVSLFVARRVALLFACIALALGASMVSGGSLGSLTMPRAHAASNTLFSDGFESGNFANWTTVSTGGDATATVQSTTKHTGTYAADLSETSNVGSSVYIRKTLSSSETDLTVDGWFNLSSRGADTPYIRLFSSATRVVSLYVGASNNIWLDTYNGSTDTYVQTSGTVTAGTWTEFNVHVIENGASSTVTVLQNGTQTYNSTAVTLSPSPLTNVQLGDEFSAHAFTYYADDVTVTTPVTYSCATTYYISTTGSDTNNNGTSSSSPWQSLSKAGSAPLNAGDCLLFQRGGTWTGSLSVSRSGTSISSITVGAYGTGNLPKITSGTAGAHIVNVTSSYVTLDSLDIVATPPGYSTCGGVSVPEGWIAGFTLESGALHDTIQNDTVSGAQSGIYIVSGANYNTVQDNQLLDNTLYQQSAGSGAYGISLHGSNNTIQYNTINGSHQCSNSYGTDGAAVEVYAGASNTIQYNKANEDDAFSEVTETSADNADSNLFYYNLYWSDLTKSIFVNQHGNVLYTDLYNNTVYLTGSSSQGFLNASGSSMWLRNNIIQAAWKDGWNGGTLSEDYDLFWPTAALRSFTVGTHSKVADPLFTSPGTGSTADFHIPSTSPAVGMGIGLSFTADLDGKAVTNPPDAGAYQH